jgi:hypothetical protein
VAEAAAPRAEARVDLVDAARDAPHVMPAGLVAHGVGQELDGMVAVHAVAVEVEQ